MLINGDSLTELKQFEDNSIDSMVTDPPAGIAFMGKKWDTKDVFQLQMRAIFEECYRVLKPGAHGFVWALPKTSHWTATALEEAGFEIRDVVTHVFGSGFPKSHNVGKSIDKMMGNERENLGVSPNCTPTSTKDNTIFGIGCGEFQETRGNSEWEGWGTALKPASEHWILVRKSLAEINIAQNVMKHGTGAINIDASRITTDTALLEHQKKYSEYKKQNGTSIFGNKGDGIYGSPNGRFPANFMLSHHPECEEVGTRKVRSGITGTRTAGVGSFPVGPHGHWGGYGDNGEESVPAFECHPECPVAELDKQSGNRPSCSTPSTGTAKGMFGCGGTNLALYAGETGGASRFFQTFKCHPDCPVAELDKQSGNIKSVGGVMRNDSKSPGPFGVFRKKGTNIGSYAGEEGGASRFFYCAKPNKSEKNAGLDNFPDGSGCNINLRCGKCGVLKLSPPDRNQCGCKEPQWEEIEGYTKNTHPTIKPTKLMRYLITMICPPGGTVLDPFAGSCTTGVAAIQTEREFIGIEREEEYVEIGEARMTEARGDNEEQNRLFN
jgi:site-specific DNA-methyltransferase (adenine-specific)